MEPLNLNLDGLMPDELLEVAHAMSTLATYAKTKAKAMHDRASGMIADALVQEDQCERYYRSLPEWARW
jgi:hypothetical protein